MLILSSSGFVVHIVAQACALFPQIFDGHGGVAAATFASSVLLEYICEQQHFLSDPQSAMVSAAPLGYFANCCTYLHFARNVLMMYRQ